MRCFKYTALLMLIPVLSVQQATAQSLRKLLQQNAHIESKWENNAQGDLELNYYNDDFCDYYLHRENDRSYKLSVGKNTVFTKRKNSHTENPFQNPTKYRFYRGQFPKDFQVNTPYALSVKNGTETAWKTDLRDDSPVSHKIDRIYPGGIQQLKKDFAAFANNRKQ